MKIINAKQVIKSQWNGWKFYENFYHRQSDSFMLTGHGGGHENTKLFYHRLGEGHKPILHKWCDDNKIGLEDACISEKAPNGYYYLSAEAKPFNSEQKDIMTFKSKIVDASEWIPCPALTLKPFDKPYFSYSLSSPANVMDGSDLIQYYEGRDYDWDKPLYQTRPTYIIIDTKTDTVKYSHNKANIDHNVIPDDMYYKNGKWLYSLHQFDKNYTHPLGHHWFGVVYSSENRFSGFKKEYIQTLDGERVGEIYFTNSKKVYFWKDNESGMWEGYLEQSQPPTNGGAMKPIIEISNGQIKVINAESSEKYALQVGTKDYVLETWLAWLKPNDVYDIPEKYKGKWFWVYSSSNSGLLSDTIQWENDDIVPPIDQPTTCDHTKALNHIRNARAELNKAEEELMK